MSREESIPSAIPGEALAEIVQNQFHENSVGLQLRWDLNRLYAADGCDIHAEMVEKLRLKGTETVLDVGCGDGHTLVKYIQSQGHEGNLVGIDAQASILKFGRLVLGGKGEFVPNFVTANGRSLPMATSSVDVGIAAFLLYYFTESGQEAVFQELKRVIRCGGKLAIATNDPSHKPRMYKFKSLVAQELGIPTPPRAPHSFSPSRAKQLAKEVGFRIIDDTTHSSYLDIDSEAACEDYIGAFNTYRVDFKPHPGTKGWKRPDWETIIDKVVRQPIMDEVRSKGRFTDPIKRSISVAINEK